MQRHEKPSLTPAQIKELLQSIFGDKENYIEFNENRRNERGSKLVKKFLSTTNIVDLGKITDQVKVRVGRSGSSVAITAYQENQ